MSAINVKANLNQPLSLSKLATMTVQSSNLPFESKAQLNLSTNENKSHYSSPHLNGNDDQTNQNLTINNTTRISQQFVADTANSAYDGFTHVLSCPICGFLTLSGSMLQQHAVGHASKSEVVQYSTFTCQKCSCLSTERGIMLEHIKIYHRNTHSPVHLIEEKHTLSVDTNFSDSDIQLNNNNKGEISSYNSMDELAKPESTTFNGFKSSPCSRSIASSNEEIEDDEIDVVNNVCDKECLPDDSESFSTNVKAERAPVESDRSGSEPSILENIKKEGHFGSRRRKPNNPGRVETPNSSVINVDESVTKLTLSESPAILKSMTTSLDTVSPAKQRKVSLNSSLNIDNNNTGKASSQCAQDVSAANFNQNKSQKVSRSRTNRKKQSSIYGTSGLLPESPASLPASPLCLTKSQPLNINLNQDSDQAIDMSMKSQTNNATIMSTSSMSNISPVLQFTNLQLPASSQLIEMAARLSPHTLASTMAAMAAVNSSNPTQSGSAATSIPALQGQQHVSSDVADVLHRLSAASALFQHLQQSSVIADYSQPKLVHPTNGPLSFRSVSHEPAVTRSSCSSPAEVTCDSVAPLFRNASQPSYDLAMDLKIDTKASIVQTSVVQPPSVNSTSKTKCSNSGVAKSNKDGSCVSRPHRQNFTPLQNKILTEWYHEHKDKPYPSTEETNMLTKKADLSYPQVKKWFANKRARTSMCIKKPARNSLSNDSIVANQENYQSGMKMSDSIKTEPCDDDCSQSSNSLLANENEVEVDNCNLTNESAKSVSTIFPEFNQSACSPNDRGNEDIASHLSNTAKAF